MILLTLLQLLLVAIGAVLFYNYYYKRRNLPPGPTPVPFFGNVGEMMKKSSVEDAFVEWKKIYGDVFTYWIGERPVVCVADYNAIMETFQKDGDTFAGRPERNRELDILIEGAPRDGLVFSEGELWQEHRRFALHVLRDFGVGKDLMQEKILDEVAAMVGKINKNVDQELQEQDIPVLLNVGVGSIINSLLFGYRFDESRESEFYELKRLTSNDLKHPGGLAFRLLGMYPRLLHRIPPFKAAYELKSRNSKALMDFYQRQIDEHVKSIDFGTDAEPTDYSEAFLREKAKRDADGVPHSFTINQLKGICFELFMAGQETTTGTLSWGVSYLIHNPEAQKRLHEELDRVIGSDRLITVADRPNLPYTQAVINETQRLCNIFPQNLPHTTTKDVLIDGYLVPKGTVIMPQISAVLYDEKVFPEPKSFKPERFLDPKGNLKRVDELIPFSVGKRQCLGEGLARMELFLFLANLFNQFQISAGKELPSLKRSRGATVQCPPYMCCVEKRSF